MNKLLFKNIPLGSSDSKRIRRIMSNLGYIEVDYDSIETDKTSDYKTFEVCNTLMEFATDKSMVEYVDPITFLHVQSVGFHDTYATLVVRMDSNRKQYCLPKKLHVITARH